MSAGIDYGLGKTNVDVDTGIRYGVIPVHAVTQAWCDSAESRYGDPTCPECGSDVTEIDATDDKDCGNWRCVTCDHVTQCDGVYPESPLSWVLDDGEYQAEQSGDDVDIFVFKAPFFTRAAYCSPCAPGACYLTSPTEDGDRAYCLGHDWFEDQAAPYPVYSVATGELVQPKPR